MSANFDEFLDHIYRPWYRGAVPDGPYLCSLHEDCRAFPPVAFDCHKRRRGQACPPEELLAATWWRLVLWRRPLYLALHTAKPGGDQRDHEVVYGEYARAPVARVANEQEVRFPLGTSGQMQPATWSSIGTSPKGRGMIVFRMELYRPFSVGAHLQPFVRFELPNHLKLL